MIVALVWSALIATPALAASAPTPEAGATQAAEAAKSGLIDFAAPSVTIDLRGELSPYHAPSGEEADGSRWYIVTFANDTAAPLTRILMAGQPPDAALRVLPMATRAEIRKLVSSDGNISIKEEPAFGTYAYRVTVPGHMRATAALRMANGDAPPSVLAWKEAALVAYHDRLSLFIATVAGLIAAAAAISGGVAVMTAHAPPRWAGLVLVGVFTVWMAATGLFDATWSTAIGGPYGFRAMALGLSLAAAIQLAECVAPFSDIWPWAEKFRRWGLIALVALSAFAFVGVPGAALLINIAVLVGAAGVAAYLVRRGMTGTRAARVLAPSATVFALVTVAAAIAMLGGYRGNPMAGEIVGGFAAVGAVLLALAVAAGEGIGLMTPRDAHAYGQTTFRASDAEAETVAVQPIPTHRDSETDALPAGLTAALAAIGASHQGVYELDFHSDSLRLSAEGAGLIGQATGARTLSHAAWIARVHDDDRTIYEDALRDYRNHPGLAFRIEFRVRSESGRFPWFELRATMIGDGQQADRCLGLMADITTRKEAEAAVIDRTLRDPLTGLGNRVALMEDLDRLGQGPWNVVFAILDIDRFKAIHASLGDTGADAVLCQVAGRLTSRFGTRAEVFRVGGDSFALLIANAGSEAGEIGAELVELCTAPFVENGRNIFAPASVGLAKGTQTREPLDLLRNAELALRHAKRQGGGAYTYSRELDGSHPGDAVALEADLRRALEDGQLDVFYQPIMRLSDRSVAGFEALLRWHHPERGLVWPADFIGHSEETGLIVALGRFALTRAAEDLARWQRFFPVDPPLFVSVNVSRRQLQDSSLEEDLTEALEKSGVSDGSLCLEVTESAIAASDASEERLARLHDMGAGLAIDDFGTGMSSLSQLRAIPFGTVKIDKSFLARHGVNETDDEGEVILNSIVALAHELKRGIVVEGVESEEDAIRIAELGCEFAQGFHFSVPLPAREALNFIAHHHATDGRKPGAANGPPRETGQGGASGAAGV